ncbi:MAG: hypothetical protein AAGM22_18750 [Acidobacteriota bacterium]
MDKWLFGAAAVFALLGLLAHEFLGAPRVLDPLTGAGLPPEVVWLHHFSWHVGTVATAAMVVMFFFASRRPDRLPPAILATAMSLSFAGIGIGLAIGPGPELWRTPAPYLWSLVSMLGGLGIWTSPGRRLRRR